MVSTASVNTRLWPLRTWLGSRVSSLCSTYDRLHTTVKEQTQARADSDTTGLLLLFNHHGSGLNPSTWTSQPPICPVEMHERWRSPQIPKCEEEELQRLLPSRDGLYEMQDAHKENDNGQKTNKHPGECCCLRVKDSKWEERGESSLFTLIFVCNRNSCKSQINSSTYCFTKYLCY